MTLPLPVGVQKRVAGDLRNGTAGNLVWEQESGTLLVDFETVFLKPAFYADEWIVVISQPRSEAFAAARRFTRALILSITLVALMAGLFAHVQIRRCVAPLAVLKEGTRRISGGDFGSRVEIASGDEFEDLGRSFNTMADRLGREFRVQSDMGRIVQGILAETERGGIVEAVLEGVNDVVPCDFAGLTLLDPGVVEDAAITCIREYAPGAPSTTRKVILSLSTDEVRRLLSADQGVVAGRDAEFAYLLSGWPGPRPAAFLLAPLVSKGKLAGVLLLGYRLPPDPTHETLVRIRQVADQTNIALSRSQLIEELRQNDLGTLTALARAVDANSAWTAGHSERVTVLATEIGRELGLSKDEIEQLHRGGLLHDIGKIGVPSSILDKQATLTEEEFAVIRSHPSKGVMILRPIPNLQRVLPLVSQHHERFDGKGYPRGLSGESISLQARILAVADVVDALVSERPYRGGWKREKVLEFTRENAGRHFDPQVVEAFFRVEAKRGGNAIAGVGFGP
jgi:putative nucleotidyltransferase with HDIG domain